MKGRGDIFVCGFHITYLTSLACINVSEGTLQTWSFRQIVIWEWNDGEGGSECLTYFQTDTQINH